MKSKPSKLDPFAERLTQWFTPKDKGGDGLTIAEAQAQLKLDGCCVSSGRLSKWWSARQREQAQADLLVQIASGAAQCKAVEQQFGKHPPAELATLIQLHRHLIFQLSTQGGTNPETLTLLSGLMKSVLVFAQLDVKKEEVELTRAKFQRETCELFLKWSADQKAREVTGSNLSYADKIEQLGQTMFGDSWK